MTGSAWTYAALATYGLSGALYFAFLGGVSEAVTRWARVTLVAALLLHTLETGARAIAGFHPVSSAQDAVAFSAWILVGIYLLTSLRWRLGAVGALIAPVALVMLLVARISPGAAGGPAEGLGVLGRAHITLAIGGTAAYALAATLAVLYLFQERQLKRRRVTAIVRKGLGLETLDMLLHRCGQVGFPLFTLSIVAGVLWSARRGASLRAEYPIAIVAWGVFAALLLARSTGGWRGRRAAKLTLLGFGASLVVLGIYVARRVMGA